MTGLLSLLVYAALFYLMMRFGCGAHMVHGHGGHEGNRGTGGGADSAKDPVTVVLSRTYRGNEAHQR